MSATPDGTGKMLFPFHILNFVTKKGGNDQISLAKGLSIRQMAARRTLSTISRVIRRSDSRDGRWIMLKKQ